MADSEPKNDVIKYVAAALGATRPSELQRALVNGHALDWEKARNVGRWWNAKNYPTGETTIRLLAFAGLLEWPPTSRTLRDAAKESPERRAERLAAFAAELARLEAQAKLPPGRRASTP